MMIENLSYTDKLKLNEKLQKSIFNCTYETFAMFKNFEERVNFSLEITKEQVEKIISKIRQNIESNNAVSYDLSPINDIFSINKANLELIFKELNFNNLVDRMSVMAHLFSCFNNISKEDIEELLILDGECYAIDESIAFLIDELMKITVYKCGLSSSDMTSIILDRLIPYIMSDNLKLVDAETGEEIKDENEIRTRKNKILNNTLWEICERVEMLEGTLEIKESFIFDNLERLDPSYILPLYSKVSDSKKEEIKKKLQFDIEEVVREKFKFLSDEELSVLNIDVTIDCDSYLLFREVNDNPSMISSKLKPLTKSILNSTYGRGGFTVANTANQIAGLQTAVQKVYQQTNFKLGLTSSTPFSTIIVDTLPPEAE